MINFIRGYTKLYINSFIERAFTVMVYALIIMILILFFLVVVAGGIVWVVITGDYIASIIKVDVFTSVTTSCAGVIIYYMSIFSYYKLIKNLMFYRDAAKSVIARSTALREWFTVVSELGKV